MKLSDRIRRWWAPGKRRDEHPEISGDGFSLATDERLDDIVARPGGIPNWAGNGGAADRGERD